MAGPLDVDNYLVNLESWDISAHLTVFQTNPLTLSYFDATVICFDVTDEANLQSVVDKVRFPHSQQLNIVTRDNTDP